MQPDQVPMPAAIAARPRDQRGYPVLAITPWRDGVPDFAVTSPARILVCAVERRCSICGLALGAGPVWRVVSADEAAAITAGPAGDHLVTTVEPPGHELCMTYAAVVCPWLARPNARRRFDAEVVGVRISRGDARGALGDVGGALVSYAGYEFTAGERVEFCYREPLSVRTHLSGEEHLAELRESAAGEPPPREVCPPWLLGDEGAAEDRSRRYL